MVEQPAGRRSDDPLSPVFESLSTARRRRILGVVLSRSPAAVSESDLAAIVAAGSLGKGVVDLERAEYERAVTQLRHVHLPLLADAGLIERDGSDVLAANHAAYRDEGVRAALETRVEEDEGAGHDDVFGALSNRRRRTTLAVLADLDRPVSVETLARAVAVRAFDCGEREVTDAELERVHVSLVHDHLPALEDADLIGRENDRVAYEGHPNLRRRWLESGLADSNDSDVDSTRFHVDHFDGMGANVLSQLSL